MLVVPIFFGCSSQGVAVEKTATALSLELQLAMVVTIVAPVGVAAVAVNWVGPPTLVGPVTTIVVGGGPSTVTVVLSEMVLAPTTDSLAVI